MVMIVKQQRVNFLMTATVAIPDQRRSNRKPDQM